jgi:ABC-2 type transport system ATP-binding protein
MIEVQELTKRYGPALAFDALSFSVRPGAVTGFLGANGSGKSTTMRLILGLDRPDAGQVRIGGRRFRDQRWPLREVGALLEAGAFHPGRSARAHLAALAASNAIPRRRVDEVLDMVGLASAAGRRAGAFSLGMAQRLGIAAALLGDPPVLLLDEPVNGLDPAGIRWIQGRLLADTSVAAMSAGAPSLEAAFLALTDGGAQYRAAAAGDSRPRLAAWPPATSRNGGSS